MKLCLIIYKIDPEKGSEDASGYHLAKEIVRKYTDTVIISRKNNIENIKDDPDFKGIELVGVDVPGVLSFYKKKSRGIILYYYLWQIFVGLKVWSLDKEKKFDIIHQLNFHTDWAPHFIMPSQARIIWGPLAHHPVVPWSWFPQKLKYLYLKEIAVKLIKNMYWHLNPALKAAIRNSDCILFANSDIPAPYQKHGKNKLQIYAGSHWPVQPAHRHDDTFNIVFVGRLIPLKGPHLVCDAYLYFLQHASIADKKPNLTIIGSGPLEETIKDKLHRINQLYSDTGTFYPWLNREELIEHYQKSDFMLYPSLEAQGLVVSEALSQNCAVITLAQTGPACITQYDELTITANREDYSHVVVALGQKLIDLYQMQQNDPFQYVEIFEKVSNRAKDLQWPEIANNIMKNYSA